MPTLSAMFSVSPYSVTRLLSFQTSDGLSIKMLFVLDSSLMVSRGPTARRGRQASQNLNRRCGAPLTAAPVKRRRALRGSNLLNSNRSKLIAWRWSSAGASERGAEGAGLEGAVLPRPYQPKDSSAWDPANANNTTGQCRSERSL
jgi:hypothetical protein